MHAFASWLNTKHFLYNPRDPSLQQHLSYYKSWCGRLGTNLTSFSSLVIHWLLVDRPAFQGWQTLMDWLCFTFMCIHSDTKPGCTYVPAIGRNVFCAVSDFA